MLLTDTHQHQNRALIRSLNASPDHLCNLTEHLHLTVDISTPLQPQFGEFPVLKKVEKLTIDTHRRIRFVWQMLRQPLQDELVSMARWPGIRQLHIMDVTGVPLVFLISCISLDSLVLRGAAGFEMDFLSHAVSLMLPLTPSGRPAPLTHKSIRKVSVEFWSENGITRFRTLMNTTAPVIRHLTMNFFRTVIVTLPQTLLNLHVLTIRPGQLEMLLCTPDILRSVPAGAPLEQVRFNMDSRTIYNATEAAPTWHDIDGLLARDSDQDANPEARKIGLHIFNLHWNSADGSVREYFTQAMPRLIASGCLSVRLGNGEEVFPAASVAENI
ncbi:hypothetical protein DXG03_008673 [Asterophora parasitica]|uniref:Uncharacterized protein n=1 Tax=Asterophora parasitica TaxID=117018 RepID=A0A9P7FY52_9AGAR|nr:hypothetical protein DXG03_008673 [Asterophora parasitica]